MRSEKLLSGAEVDVLRSAETAGNLSWAMRTISAAIRRRSIARTHAILATAVPMAILAIGAVVGLFVLGGMTPIVDLIWELS
jgi:type II secretory pathway component PulF